MSSAPDVDDTIGVDGAATTAWDVAVIGAGPAGAVAALECARRGFATLLIDRLPFPRPKVCGACLNAAALKVLDELDLGDAVDANAAPALTQFELADGNSTVRMALPPGRVVTRSTLDARLVAAAIQAGAALLTGHEAVVRAIGEEKVAIGLNGIAQGPSISARVVIAADGLHARSVRHLAAIRTITAPHSRVGLGANAPADSASSLPFGRIAMTRHPSGYVGAVRLEHGSLNLAAAIDPAFIARSHGPARAVGAILDHAGSPMAALARDLQWRGVDRLSQRRAPIAAPGVFLAGDAAGFVEPFTGEGIAWALAGGRAVAACATQAVGAGPMARHRAAAQYTRWHGRTIVPRQRRCRAIAWALRQPGLTRFALAILCHVDAPARGFVARLNAAFDA